jgi:hypothetical protein
VSGWVPIKSEEQTATLDECPFCHAGETLFLKNKNFSHLMLLHLPPKGVVCPARTEQACDGQDQGAGWWNDRSKKEGVK